MLSNIRTKSVKGLSFFMIFTWFAGDLFKTIYFIMEKQPLQFVMCGCIQLTVDIIIVIQIMMYKGREDSGEGHGSAEKKGYARVGQH